MLGSLVGQWVRPAGFCLGLAGALLWVTPAAFAVDDLDLFELDGNTADSGAQVGDDFNTIYSGASGVASEQRFLIDDIGTTDNFDISIFTGGGSKDDENISSWQHTSGNVNTKNDIHHGYAAGYVYRGLPTATTLTNDYIVYMGSDVVPSGGTISLSFWLLQDPAIAPQGGGTWGGAHLAGDILVQAEIAANGTVTVRADHWSGTQLTTFATGVTCNGAGGVLCGIANTAAITTPWLATVDKGRYFEAGINVSALYRNLGLPTGCTTSILIETRSSTSQTAQLKDYTQIENFQSCLLEMSVAKTGPANAAPGETISFDITLTNDAVLPITLDSISDPLVDGQTANATRDAAIAAGCDSISAESSCSFSVDYVVTATDPDPLTNQVTASFQYPNGLVVSGADSHTVNLVQPALTMTKSAKASSFVSDVVTYTFSLANGSSGDTPDLILDQILDDVIGDLTATAQAGGCQTLASGAGCSFTSDYTVPAGVANPLVNTVNARYQPQGQNIDVEAGDSHSLTITSSADLSVTKSDAASRYTPGATSSYTITVTNNGPDPVSGAVIADNLPAGVTLNGPWSCAATAGSSCASASGGTGGDASISLSADLIDGGVITVTVPVVHASDPAAY